MKVLFATTNPAKVKKYKKVQGSKKQKKRLETINKFQDNIAKAFYNSEYKNKN